MLRGVPLLVLAVLACAIADDVIELGADTFQDGIADEDIILVEFYAPWCGHCKRLAPEYEKAATSLKKEDPPILLAKVDCPANSALCQKFGVTGYPTLKIFRNGKFSDDYGGPRSADGIVSYMKKQAGPSSKEINSVDDLEAFLKREEHHVVGFFADAGSKLAKTFQSVANSLRETFRFGHTVVDEVREAYGYDDKVVIFQPPQLHTKMEESKVVYEGDAKSSAMEAFIKDKFMGLAGIRSQDNAPLFENKKPLVVVYFEIDYERNPKGCNYWRNRVIKVAKEFDQVTFSVSNKRDFAHELDQLGLDTSEEVTVGAYDAKGKYPMSDKFSVDNLKAFVQKLVDGELEPYLKSEPIPEDNSGPVTVVVGKNFDEIVNDETKDVLIEFYAPWCGHCKSLAPKYEELGEKLKDDPNIVIAKSDATANDYPPQYEVRGFPTIFWVPAGNKSKPEKYNGGREVPDFIDFIKQKATNTPVIAGEEEKKKKKERKEEL